MGEVKIELLYLGEGAGIRDGKFFVNILSVL